MRFAPVRRWLSLDPDDLMAHAARRHGTSDFGDAGCGEGLRRLVTALEASAALGTFGRLATRQDLLRHLGTALQVQQAYAADPSLYDVALRPPLVITGLPRSGSTFLHRLLAQDPDHRVLAHWEAMRPVHRPQDAARLRRRARGELALARLLAPRLADIHPLDPDTPQECTELLAASMTSLRFDSTYDVPGYVEWLDAQGSLGAFRFHRRALQLLQAQGGQRRSSPRWVLKSPDHIFTLPALLQVYPDARLLLTHRDPRQVLPSVAHLTFVLHRMFSKAVEPRRIGAKVLERWALGAALMVKAAARPQALALAYTDIVRRPIETAQAIYRAFDWELTTTAQALMEAFVREHPRGDYGRNRYDASAYGLTDDVVAQRFPALPLTSRR